MSEWSDAVIALSPKAFYRLGESAGTTATDITGTYNGTYSGAVTLAEPSLGYADTADTSILIDAASEYVTIPAPIGTGDTVAFAYKGMGDGAGFLTFFSNPAASTANRCGLFISPGVIAVQYKGATGDSTYTAFDSALVTDGVPHLIAVSYAAGEQKVWVDGVHVGTTTQAGTATPTAGTRISQFSSSHRLAGGYDDFAVFPSILTDTDVATLYDAWLGDVVIPPIEGDTAWDTATLLGGDGLHPNNRGMAYLNEVYKAALAAAGKTPTSGQTVYAYGDSWTASNFENAPGLRAIERFADDLAVTVQNKAVSGYRCADVAARGIGSTGTYAPNASPLVLVHCGVNDLQYADTAAKRASIEVSMRALLAVLSAAERIEQDAFTFGGSWSGTAFANSVASGGSNAYATTTDGGATATYTIATPGDYYLLTHGWTGGLGNQGGSVLVTQGGTTLATVDVNAKHVATGRLASGGYGPLAVPLPGVATGPITYTHTSGGRAGSTTTLDGLVRLSSTPPTILLVKPVEVTASAWVNPTLLAYMRDLCDTLAAEFGSHVVVADPMEMAGIEGSSLRAGSAAIDALRAGSASVDAVYVGADQVWGAA